MGLVADLVTQELRESPDRPVQKRKPSDIWAASRDGAENPMMTGGAQYSLS